jgi:hypothetical protein
MKTTWWRDLDLILRGEATRDANLRRGSIEVPVGGLSVILMLLAMAYGACLGCFALFKAGGPSGLQWFATVMKVPLLFTLTLAVTLPSLYVSNALVGSRLSLLSVVRLLAATLAVIVTVLASLGTIVAFFAVSTTSYPFMVLMNVTAFSVSGALGLVFLLRTLQRLSLIRPLPAPTEAEEHIGGEKTEVPAPIGALDRLPDNEPPSSHVRTVFRCWVALFALVGAQMGWVLRPFIGNPSQPFSWFRVRDSNVFEAIMGAVRSLFL